MMQAGKQFAGFRRSEIFIYAALGLGPLGFTGLVSAQVVSARFVIEASQVTAAMREAKLPVEGAMVNLSAPVNSSVAGAQIEIESAAVIGPHEIRLRAACHDRSQCLPFFAGATFPDTVDLSKLHLARFSQASADRPADHTSQASAQKSGSVLRAGASATLEFEADRIHVKLGVICLQAGSVGSRIRVSSLDHKQTYMAEVVTPSLLKGELQK